MKKYLTFFILPVLLLALVIPSVAAGGGTARLTAQSAVAPGYEVTVTVSVENGEPILAAMLEPVYDRNVFELTDFTFRQEGCVTDFNGDDGVIAWENPTNPNGVLAVFTLKAKKTAKPGSYSVGCSYRVRDENDRLRGCETVSVLVTVTEFLRGDLTGDGAVDNQDVEYLLWYTLFPGDFSLNQNADFDENGVVDNKDVEYLLWHTLFPEEFPLS